jgi:hypothetical protein
MGSFPKNIVGLSSRCASAIQIVRPLGINR